MIASSSDGDTYYYLKPQINTPSYASHLWYSTQSTSNKGLGTGFYLLFADGNNGFLAPSVKLWSNIPSLSLSLGNGQAAIQIASNIQSSLRMCYFNSTYYITYQNTNSKLSLLSNATLYDTSYVAVSGFPTISVIGTPQIAILTDNSTSTDYLVLVYATAENAVNYIYSPDGSSWSTPKVIENLVAEDITMVVQGSGTSMQLCVIAVSNYTDTAATLNSGYILQSDLN